MPSQVEPVAETPAVDPVLAAMKRSLGALIDEKPPQPEPEKKEPEKTEETDEKKVEGEEKTEPEKEEGEPEKPSFTPEQVRSLVKDIAQEMRPPEKTPDAVEPKKEPEKDVEFLDEELAEIQLAEYASTKNNQKFNRLPTEFREFFRKNKTYIEKQIEENGEFDAEDESYKEFLKKNQPKLTRADREQLRGWQIEDRAVKATEEKMKIEHESLERQINELKVGPLVERENAKMKDAVLAVLSDDFRKAYSESPDDIAEEFQFEASVAIPVIKDVEGLIKEYYSIANGAKKFDPNDNTHKWLNDFVTTRGEQLDQAPEDKRRTTDGKIMVSRQKLASLVKTDKGNASKYTTFDDSFVIDAMKMFSAGVVKQRLEDEQKRLEKMGFRREQKQTQPTGKQQAQEKKPTSDKSDASAPKAQTSKSPGAASTVKPSPSPEFVSILNGTRRP